MVLFGFAKSGYLTVVNGLPISHKEERKSLHCGDDANFGWIKFKYHIINKPFCNLCGRCSYPENLRINKHALVPTVTTKNRVYFTIYSNPPFLD